MSCSLEGHRRGLRRPVRLRRPVQKVDDGMPLPLSWPPRPGGGRRDCAPCRLKGHGHGLCHPIQDMEGLVPLRCLGLPLWEVEGSTTPRVALRGTAAAAALDAPSGRWTAAYPSVASAAPSRKQKRRQHVKAGLRFMLPLGARPWPLLPCPGGGRQRAPPSPQVPPP